MNPSKDDSPAELTGVREWACETIGLPSDLQPIKTPLAILERLDKYDYVLSQDGHDAVEILTSQNVIPRDEIPLGYYQERKAEARERVQEFANVFWELAPEERVRQWSELNQRCSPWPPLRLWLSQLQPGLELQIEFDSLISEKLRAFTRFACHRFVQCPGAIPLEIWCEHATTFQDKKHWQPIARTFQRLFPKLAGLLPPWFQEFSNHSASSRRIWRQGFLSLMTKEWTWYIFNGKLDILPFVLIFIGFLVPILIGMIFATKSTPNVASTSYSVAKTPIPFNPTPSIQLPESFYERLARARPEEIDRIAEILFPKYPPGEASLRMSGMSKAEAKQQSFETYTRSREMAARELLGSSLPEPVLTLVIHGAFRPDVSTLEEAKKQLRQIAQHAKLRYRKPRHPFLLDQFLNRCSVNPWLADLQETVSPTALKLHGWVPPEIERIKLLVDRAPSAELSRFERFVMLQLELVKLQSIDSMHRTSESVNSGDTENPKPLRSVSDHD
ncbi:MAG: hypothetical protein JWM11_5037 [Planctomycetaceae bacterium]|nr:hypothetical protein [Planctomycetaceae bacterium]